MHLSLSARRAWIEIVVRYKPTPKPVVALRKESVDRNQNMVLWYVYWSVALRKESVDRNNIVLVSIKVSTVALRKESVDRNCHYRDDVPD